MNTKNMTHEQISALVDGELNDDQIDKALAVLRTPAGRASWDVYHQISDALRSDDMAFELSSDFAQRLTSRLEGEPAIVAPMVNRRQMKHEHAITEQINQINQINQTNITNLSTQENGKRYVFPGIAAAIAAVTLAFVGVPQLMVAMKTDLASENSHAIHATMVASAHPSSRPDAHAIVRPEQEMLRDPGIDEYLMAHQHFSPSLYSTAQYARSATFAIDSDK